LWPVKLPSDDGDDYDAWKALRKICKKAMLRWIRIVKWTGGSYLTRYAPPGYAPVPDWSTLPPYTDLLAQALGKDGIIRDREHPIYKDLMGLDQKRDIEEDDDDDDDL
jgi:hypothetical protein